MKVFLVSRTDKLNYCEDYAMVITAEDELRAERIARKKSLDFKKAKVRVDEVDMGKEQCVLVADTGA